MDITHYLTYDLPVVYKGLKIYPITVRDFTYFTIYSQCLLLDKNSVPDPRVISMTELEYIYKATQEEAEAKPYLFWFDRLLSLCIKDNDFENIETSIKRYMWNEKKKPIFIIGDTVYDSNDFKEMKKIIAGQNLIDIPDENISKEVRDSLDKAREYKNKITGNKPGSLEDYIISLSTVTGWTFEYVYSLSIRRFTKCIRRLDNYLHYKIYMTASMSGMVEFKDKSFIKHWLTSLDNENGYDDVSIDMDTMVNKLSMESAKN